MKNVQLAVVVLVLLAMMFAGVASCGSGEWDGWKSQGRDSQGRWTGTSGGCSQVWSPHQARGQLGL